MIHRIFNAFSLLLALFPAAGTYANTAELKGQDVNSLQVFVRAGCPHCAEAKRYLPELKKDYPQLNIVYRDVGKDDKARQALVDYSLQAGIWPPGVPTFVFQDRVFTGFDHADNTGPQLHALLEHGALLDNTEVNSPVFGNLNVEKLGLPLFTIALGLLDGFNPCAMWVLLFLLSMLLHLKDRKKIALIAGTFVLVSGLVYYAFMAAWLNIFLAVGLSDAVRITLAVVASLIALFNIKDFIKPGAGFSFSIPESAKPGIYSRARKVLKAQSLVLSLFAVASLAILVNFIELLCTAGLPAIYTAVLTQQAISGTAHYGFLALYILAYMFDDALMVSMAVIALKSNRITEQSGRWLKLISGGVMLALALILIFKAEWLL